MMGLNQKGFTLVELLAAIVIVGLMSAGISSLYVTISRTQHQSRMLDVAVRAGEKKLEELRNSHYNSLENNTTLNFSDELPDTLHQPRTATVEISEPTPGIKRLDLNITYQDGRRSRQVELSSLVGVLGIGQ